MKKKFLFFVLLFNFHVEKTNSIDLEKGEKVFKTNCLVCHEYGNNIIIAEKNLKKENLLTNGMNSISSISYQVTNGKNGMPAFGGRLKEENIVDVAAYILDQSQKDFQN